MEHTRSATDGLFYAESAAEIKTEDEALTTYSEKDKPWIRTELMLKTSKAYTLESKNFKSLATE